MSAPGASRGYDFEPLSYAVLGACIDVQRQLGVHCMEVDYQRALEEALKKRGLGYEREVDIPVAYEGVTVTTRRVDVVGLVCPGTGLAGGLGWWVTRARRLRCGVEAD